MRACSRLSTDGYLMVGPASKLARQNGKTKTVKKKY